MADFGVARFQNQGGVMTAETGTYRWMAPEVRYLLIFHISLIYERTCVPISLFQGPNNDLEIISLVLTDLFSPMYAGDTHTNFGDADTNVILLLSDLVKF